MEIVPLVDPEGTITVRDVAVLAVTTAIMPLNNTESLALTGLKLVPVMVITVPGTPKAGEMSVMVGKLVTVKWIGSDWSVNPAMRVLVAFKK